MNASSAAEDGFIAHEDEGLATYGAPGADEDARDIIRLLQCALCSYPVREALRLPCGNSFCRSCMPPLHTRQNVTYPLTQGRVEGFLCPFKDCSLEHSIGDCGTDVTLNRTLDVAKTCIKDYLSKPVGFSLLLEVQASEQNDDNASIGTTQRSRVVQGGRLVSTYLLASMGELDYHSNLKYTPTAADSEDQIKEQDISVVQSLREAIRSEVDCQICYAVMVEPLTTACGHTYCRRCVARVLDRSNLCPICRRQLPLATAVQGDPGNKRISQIIERFLPDLLGARISAVEFQEAVDEETNVPLFPCTLAFPMMPLFLHIFEPRYRLMTRRVLENGTRKFGMVMLNRHRRPQGDLGHIHFMQYGTLVHIEHAEMLGDGRFMLETRGTSRFRVLETSVLDGYNVGRIERVDDLPIAQEEAIEALETANVNPLEEDPVAKIEQMSTQQLLEYCLAFVENARSRSAPWLHRRILRTYGEPPSDPALFPYWLACILPIADEQKYPLLAATSVRERLKIAARWVQRLEAVVWPNSPACTVL